MGAALSAVVFRPPEASYGNDPNLIWLNTSAKHVIPAFYLDRQAPHTLLFSHGNAEDLGGEGVVKKMRDLAVSIDVNVFAYEYTGYGMSTGDPSEEAMYADIEAAYKYLTDIMGIPSEQIILYGWSLGSGPSVHLASKAPVRALVLQSALASVFRVAFATQFTWPGDMFANVDKICNVTCPIFIMHGAEDETVPLWHAQELVASCPKKRVYPPLYLAGAGHCDMEKVGRQELHDKFRAFLTFLEEGREDVAGTAEEVIEDERKLRAAAWQALKNISACDGSKGQVLVWEDASKSLKQAGKIPTATAVPVAAS